MKERPILFSGAMVRSLLNCTKSQTRRVVKPRYITKDDFGRDLVPAFPEIASPYGQPGDRLWVREAWATHACFDNIPPRDLTTRSIHYQADGKVETGKYRQAFHMPRWASRIDLEITGVRVERLNDISENDAKAEGVHGCDWGHGMDYGGPACYTKPFKALWEQINGAGSWDTNPWVWAVEFKRVAS